MAKPLGRMLFAVAVLLPVVVHAAESVKLRPLAPIYVDANGAGIRQPEGVGCGDGSLIVIADTGNGRLLTYTVSSGSVTPRAEYSLPQIPYPIKVQFDPKGDMLALDGKSRRIGRVSSSGEFKGYLDVGGVTGTVVVRSFRIDGDGTAYILDVFSERLIVADSSGRALREIPFPEGVGFYSDLAVDRKGNVFLVDSVGKRVFAAREGANEIVPLTGTFDEEADFPTSVAVDERGQLFVGDQNGGGIVIFGPDGSYRGRQLMMGWKEAFLRYPSEVCVDGNSVLYVADRGNNRVQSFLITQ